MASSATAPNAPSKQVLVPVANGSEEIEAVSVIDTLRRAGAAVTVASVEESLQVVCSRGVRLVADKSIADIVDQPFDLVVLPGGMPGAERLRDSSVLRQILLRQRAEDKLYAAICAAPAVVLKAHGLLEGVSQATAHPGFVKELPLADPAQAERRVVVSGRCVTSRSPGTALEFALMLVELLYGASKADEVAAPMLVRPWRA